MKHKYPLLFYILFTLSFQGCVKDPELGDEIKNALMPEVKTNDDIKTTATTVTLSGEVIKENGAHVTESGFCWGMTSDFQVDKENIKAVSKGKGTFNTTIESLNNNTKYYIKAYAINQVDTAFGDVLQFTTTSGVGTVKTSEAEKIMATKAQCGGVITQQGEAEITERGIYLMKSVEPAVVDSILKIEMETDSFYCTVSGLTPLTRYYVRAYAKNKFGEFNGSNLISFVTTDGMPVIENFQNKEISYTYADFSFDITDEGDNEVTACGLCYGPDKNPTIETADTIMCGKGAGQFSGRLTNLDQQKQYYVRAFAINEMGIRYSSGEGYSLILLNELPTVQTTEVTDVVSGTATVSGEVLSEGASDVTESGICWNTTANATIETNIGILPISYGKTKFSGKMTGLKGGTTYYVRAYAINAKGVQYGQYLTVKTPDIFSSVADFTGSFRIPGSSAYCMIDNNMCFLLGGDSGPKYTDELWMFVADTRNEWQQLSSMPQELAWKACFSRGFGLWAFGGLTSGGKINNNLYFYSTIDNSWSEVQEDKSTRPQGMSRAGCGVFNDQVYFIGGRRDSLINEVWTFNSDSYVWSRKGNFPIKQSDGVALVIGDRVYAGLGKVNPNSMSASYTKRLWSSTNLSSWSEETEWPGDGGIQKGFSLNGDLYVIDTNGNIWRYDTTAKTWSQKSKLPAANKDIHCVYVVDGKVLLGLGINGNKLIGYDYTWDN